MNNNEQYIEALKRGGHRITEQRLAICDYLSRTESHPTPSDVYLALSESHPEISRATVYNTLNALRDLGAIVELSVGGVHTHYDTNPDPHVNLVCLRCKQVFDYDGGMSLGELSRKVHAESGFQSVAMQVQIMGFCAECRARKRAEIRHQLQK
jgi:Fur family transcriptional regulator, peroxide stress response regulator